MPLTHGSRLGLAGLGIALITGCGEADRAPAEQPTPIGSEPTESLAASGEGGVEIWYTLSRTSKAPNGSSCIERGLEIRRGTQRIQVPLLYTGDTPKLLNDSTLRAVLWTNCQPGDAYLVDLRNGRPVREGARKPS